LKQSPDVQIINLDALTYAGSLANLNNLSDPARHTFIQGNICDRPLVDRLLHEYEIDTVVHFAAESHVDRSILGPGQFVQTNIIGTFTLLDAVRQAWLAEKTRPSESVRFHHVSTDEVYGTLGPGDPAFCENTPYAPRSPYAASKASSDHLVRAYFHTYGLPVSITNCSNNYGPRQFPEKLIPLMILNAKTGKPLPIYGDGMQIRDWLYVEDHCEAILRVILSGRTGETYNVGGNNQPPNIEIVRTICTILDELQPDSIFRPHASLMSHITDRPGHDRRYDVNIEKIGAELGWEPRQSLQTGLRQTVAWYLEHPDWVDEIHQQSDLQSWMTKNYAERGGKK
jgi:dTDP-glucose 4,6-dehydratase